jgi:hypothetical protein
VARTTAVLVLTAVPDSFEIIEQNITGYDKKFDSKNKIASK